MDRRTAILGAVLLLAAAATPTQAQNTTTLSALVTITPSLAISTVRDMDFGSIPQGLDNVYIGEPAIDTRAGHVRVTALSGFDVVLVFQLPTEMSDGAGHSIPLTEWFGALVAVGPGTTTFTPNPAAAQTAIIGADNMLDVFIGARLGLDPNQFPASYSAVIVVNCFFN